MEINKNGIKKKFQSLKMIISNLLLDWMLQQQRINSIKQK